MEKPKFIIAKNLPQKLPVFQSITAYMALRYFSAPEWLYGVVGLLFVVYWAANIYAIFAGEAVDIFEKKP